MRPHIVTRCGADTGTRFDGYKDVPDVQSFVGASASITIESPAFCTINSKGKKVGKGDNAVSAWVMIAGGGGYAQAGVMSLYPDCPKWFAEYWSANEPTHFKIGPDCLPIGSTDRFAVVYDAESSSLFMKVNGNVVMKTPPALVWTWTGTLLPEFSGEATYLEDDMPGNLYAPTKFTNLQTQSYYSYKFSDASCKTMVKVNEGRAERSDGESWYDDCVGPSFNIFTDESGL